MIARRYLNGRMAIALLACGLPLAMVGCAEKNVHATPPAYVPPAPTQAQRPMTYAPDTDATPPVEAVAPPPAVPDSSAPPAPATILSAKPPALRRPAREQPVADAQVVPPQAPAPQISPQLSLGDEAAFKRKTGEDISIAEKNLQRANGRQLNAAQQDFVAKIRGFLGQSQDAGNSGDWARAQNLAQKARLLSVELVNSF